MARVLGTLVIASLITVASVASAPAQETDEERIAALEEQVADQAEEIDDLRAEVTKLSLGLAALRGSRSSAPATDDGGDEQEAVAAVAAPINEPDPEPESEPAPIAGAPGTSEENAAPVGTTVEAADVAATLSSAYLAGEYGFSTPKGGYTFLVIEVTLEAVGEDHSYNEGQFRAYDVDTGAEFSNAFSLADGMIGNGDLSSGEFVSGTVLLEIQQSASAVVVKYDPQAFDTNDMYWLVPLV